MLIIRAGIRSDSKIEDEEKTLDDQGSNTTGRLYTDVQELFLGEGVGTIRISWKISESNMLDWIGLFDEVESNCTNYFDYRIVGGCSSRSLQWSFPGSLINTTSTNHLQLRYFDGLNGSLRATSRSIFVSSVPSILITSVSSLSLLSQSHATSLLIRSGARMLHQSGITSRGNWPHLSVRVNSSENQEVTVCIVDAETASSNHPKVSVVTRYFPDFSEITRRRPTRVSSLCNMYSSFGSDSSSKTSNSATSRIRERLGPLPTGWEPRMDWHGRIFYVDHTNRRTTWTRPQMTEAASNASSKVYQPTRRTVTATVTPPTDPETIAIQFLQRQDFISLLHSNQVALGIYNNSRIVKHAVHKIRSHNKNGAVSLATFEQNEEFVRFVNAFADTTQRLPANWQASGDFPPIFIDHHSRKTTLLDPRLPLPSDGSGRERRTRSAPPTRDVNGNHVSLLGNGRTEELMSAVSERLPEMLPRLRRKLKMLERLGEAGMARLVNDLEIATAISLLDTEEKEISTKESTREGLDEQFDDKLNHFYTSLQRSGYAKGPAKMRLRFSRNSLLHDAFEQILSADPMQLRRARLSIAFDDEDGLDYGGPSRELFFLLSRELFNPYYGLFEYAAADRYTVQISTLASYVENNLKWMELAGRVLGLALVHRCLIDTFFTRTFYKMLLEKPYVLSDLQSVDPEFHNSLLWMRTNKVAVSDGFTFSVTQEIAGEVSERDLLPNGRDLAVTDANKEDFIELMIKWRIERGVQTQTRALLNALHQIIDRDFLGVFSVEQLELVLSGSLEIDLEDWRANTEYKGGYSQDHVVIRWLWDTVEEMSNADRLKLLQV